MIAFCLRPFLDQGEDPLCYAATNWGVEGTDPVQVTMWAATSAGFATAKATVPERQRSGATVDVRIQDWRDISGPLEIRRQGDPEDERLPLETQIGEVSITSDKYDSEEVLALYKDVKARRLG